MSLRLLPVCFAFGTVVLFPEVGVWIHPLDDCDQGTPSLVSDHICGQSAGPSFGPVFEGGEICRGRCLWTLFSLEDVHLSSGCWRGCAAAFGLVFGCGSVVVYTTCGSIGDPLLMGAASYRTLM